MVVPLAIFTVFCIHSTVFRWIPPFFDSRHGRAEFDINVLLLQFFQIIICQGLVKGSQQSRTSLHQSQFDVFDHFRIPLGNILLQKVIQLRSKFTTGGPTTDHDKGQQSAAFFCTNIGVRSAFETFQDAISYLTGMVQMLEKEDFFALSFGNARCIEGIGFIARRDAQVVILDIEFMSLEQILTLDDLIFCVESSGLGLIIFSQPFNGSNGFLNGTEFQCPNGRARKKWREKEVICWRNQSHIIEILIDTSCQSITAPSRAKNNHTRPLCLHRCKGANQFGGHSKSWIRCERGSKF
mmetsp:Transcript_37659/g.91474  ORF Transcript_37659/g.91474 Transcript_37659/m.91474 type:complete len:296 (-) Transcript_37659:164-1051(-)